MIWSTNLRFNTEKSPYREAYLYLHNMNRKIHKSINKVIAVAVTEYFKRLEKKADDPYFENREREELFAERIVREVGNAVEKAMPVFMATYLTEKSLNNINSDKSGTAIEKTADDPEISNTDEDFIDYGFADDTPEISTE